MLASRVALRVVTDLIKALKFVVKQNGKFSASLGNSSGTLNFSGRFKDGKVTGKVRERSDDPLLGKCDTGKVTFTAKR